MRPTARSKSLVRRRLGACLRRKRVVCTCVNAHDDVLHDRVGDIDCQRRGKRYLPEMFEDFRLVAKAYHDLSRYDVVIDVRYGADDSVGPIRAEIKCVDVMRCARSIGAITVLQTPSWSI